MIAKHKRQYRKHSSHPRLALITLVVVFVGLVGYTIFRIRPGEAHESLGNQHIEPPGIWEDYNTTPPTSGPHYGYIANWGIYDEPIQNEVQVHNLEDGGVMVQYNCDVTEPDCQTLVGQLTEVVKRYPDYVILAPYPDMESRIALTAWTVLDAFEEFDEARIVHFINEYSGEDNH